MSEIKWSSRLSVGNDTLDGQHRQLLEMINALRPSALSGDLGSSAQAALDRMERYLRDHFRYEEWCLHAGKYPDFWEHKKKHLSFVRTFLALRSRAYKDDGARLDAMRRFLVDWLRDHIMGVDQRYSAFFANNPWPQEQKEEAS